MKVIERNKTEWKGISLPKITVTTGELVNLLRSVPAANDSIQLQVGESYSDHIVMETLSEIEEHAAKIEIPCYVTLDGLQIKITNYNCSITYESSQTVLAKTLEKRLSAYRPWYGRVLANPDWYFYSLAATITLLILILADNLSRFETVISLIGANLLLVFALYMAQMKYDKPFIKHVERESFWNRNSDKILIGLIMLFLGMTLRELFVRFIN